MGQTLIKVDKIYEQQEKQVEYQQQLEENACTEEERREELDKILNMLSNKRSKNGK